MIATASGIECVWGVTTATRLTEPHDLNPVGELEDVRHVVADQDHRKTALAHALNEVEHLPRLLDAERCGRLVHDHHALRPSGGPGDGDALTLPAGEVLDRLGHRADANLELREMSCGLAPHGAFVEHA